MLSWEGSESAIIVSSRDASGEKGMEGTMRMGKE